MSYYRVIPRDVLTLELSDMARIIRNASPSKITAADRARMAAAVARADAARAAARRRERLARLAVVAAVVAVAVAMFYAASGPDPDLARYDAMRGPAVIASGLTIGACMDLFSRDVADACERVR